MVSDTVSTGIRYQPQSSGTAITPSAMLLRPTALVVTGTSSSPELRLIDDYVLSGTTVDVNQNYTVLTSEIQPAISASGTDSTPSGFGIVQMQSSNTTGDFVGVVLHVRSQAFDRVLANKQRKDFSTYMGVGSLVPLKSKPD